MTIRVLLVDDQAIVRSGLKLAFAEADDLSVVGEAADGREAVEQTGITSPDVVVMDVRMSRLDGITATEQVLAVSPSTRVLMLSTFGEDEEVFRALRAGASGYLLKDAEPRDIVAAVRAVHAGENVVAPGVTRALIDAALTATPVQRRQGPSLDETLSPRELEVLKLLATGRSNQQIARELYLSEPTVKTHVSAILGKLSLRSRVQAVVLAYETGLVNPGGEVGFGG